MYTILKLILGSKIISKLSTSRSENRQYFTNKIVNFNQFNRILYNILHDIIKGGRVLIYFDVQQRKQECH